MRFLTKLHGQGLGYSAIATARSAISTYAEEIDGQKIGTHPIITRQLRGIYNLNPPKPKYKKSWDINIVLEMLKKWYPLDQLGIKKLTFKALMLLVISTTQRTQTMADIKVENLEWYQDTVVIKMDTKSKHTQIGQKLDLIEVFKYQDKKLCPFRTLRTYCDKLNTTERNIKACGLFRSSKHTLSE